MDISKLTEIQLLSLQTKMMMQYKQLEANLNAIGKEIQKRVEEHDKSETPKEEATTSNKNI